MTQPSRWTLGFIAALTVTVSVVLGVSAFLIRGPSASPDELSYLLNGRVLTGHNEIPLPNVRAFYQAGYSMVTSIGSLFNASIDVQFRISLLVNMLCVVLTGVVLYALVRRHFSTSRTWALLIATAISVAPSVAAFSLFAYAESLSRLLIALVVLLVFEISKSPTSWNMLATGVVAGFLPIVHGRFVLLLPLTAIAIIVVGLTMQPCPNKRCSNKYSAYKLVVIGLLACAVVYLVFDQVNAFLRDELYGASTGKEDRMLARMSTLNEWPHILRSAAGQAWYVISSSFGLAFVGLAVMAVNAWRRVSQRSWRDAIPAVYIIGLVCAVALTSAVQLAHVTRPDHLIYGRYVEAVSPALIAIACAALLTAKLWKVWGIGIATIAALAITLVIAAGGDRLREMIVANRYFSPPNAIALDWTRNTFEPIGYVVLSVVLIAMSIVLMVLWKQSPAVALTVLCSVGALSTIHTATQTVIPYREIRDDMVLDNQIDNLTDSDKRPRTVIAVDMNSRAGNSFVDYRYLVHPVQVLPVDSDDVVPDDVNCMIGVPDKPPVASGWTEQAYESVLDLTLWMRQGLDSC